MAQPTAIVTFRDSWVELHADDRSAPTIQYRNADDADALDSAMASHPSVIVSVQPFADRLRGEAEFVVESMEAALSMVRHRQPDSRIVVLAVPGQKRLSQRSLDAINTHLRQYSAHVNAEWIDLQPSR
jgi:hypothetical protein